MVINYFPHDSNARSDNKIISLRMHHGWEGYGIYWAIIEKLRDSAGYRLAGNYEAIAYDLRTETTTIQSIVNDFGLFVLDSQGQFFSPSLLRRMEVKDDRSTRSREAANARWRKLRCEGNADAVPLHSPGTTSGNAEAMPEKEKKSKADKNKEGFLFKKAPPWAERKQIERLVFEVFLRDRHFVTAREETERMLDYYDSRGWQASGSAITDAAAAARLWEPRSRPPILPQSAAVSLCLLYDVLMRENVEFTWRQYMISGGRFDAETGKLLLCCPESFGKLATQIRKPLTEEIHAAQGTPFRLIYKDKI